jgi:hypothetical protein
MDIVVCVRQEKVEDEAWMDKESGLWVKMRRLVGGRWGILNAGEIRGHA